MRLLAAYIPSLLLLTFVCPDASLGEITRKHHPWGRFQPGAWKLVQVVTETFDQSGTLGSVTVTKTTLNQVEKNAVTLLVEVSVDLAGRQFYPEPQKVQQGFHGELASPETKVTDLGTGKVTVQDREIVCKIEQVEIAGPTSKTITKIYYSDTVEPFILKRESTTTDLEGKVLGETTIDVVALDVPYNVLGVIRDSAHLIIVHKHAKGTTKTLAVTSMEVPGGVVCHSLTEMDDSGRTIRRSSLRLLDYGLEPDREDRGGFFQRRRMRRAKRAYRHSVPQQP